MHSEEELLRKIDEKRMWCSEEVNVLVEIKDYKEKECEVIGGELNKESVELEQLIQESLELTIKFEYRTFIYY